MAKTAPPEVAGGCILSYVMLENSWAAEDAVSTAYLADYNHRT